MRGLSGPNKRETGGRRPLRKKNSSGEQPLRVARRDARLQGGGRCGKRTAPVRSLHAKLERAQRARDCRKEVAAEKGPLPRAAPMRGSSGPNKRETAGRRPLRKKDRSREHPLCEARAGPTSARLQRGGRCGKKSVAASRANTRHERPNTRECMDAWMHGCMDASTDGRMDGEREGEREGGWIGY